MANKKTIEAVVERIKDRGDAYTYFFDSLPSAKWVRPLMDAGFFSQPPSPKDEADAAAPKFWPESRYLARVAGSDPDAVLAAIKEIPPTENYHVREDIIKAAVAMPVGHSAQLVGRLKSMLTPPVSFMIPERLGTLCRQLAEGLRAGESLELAGALLDVVADPRIDETRDDAQSPRFQARPRFDFHAYEEVARRLAPVLGRETGLGGVELLARLLCKALKYEYGNVRDYASDSSYHWYNDIEENDRPSRGVKCVLVGAVRDASEALIEAHPEENPRILSILRRCPFLIFQRLEFHLLRRSPEGCGERIAEIVGDPGKYDNFHVEHEYRLLVAACFSGLPGEIKERYLSWVDEALDPNEELWGDPSDEVRLERHRRRQLRRLYGLREALPASWQAKYDKLVAEFGTPGPAELPFKTSASFIARKSPRSKEELAGMRAPELIEFLRTWHPPQTTFDEPSREGLAEALLDAIADAPEHFANDAASFTTAGSRYVSAVFAGFQKACDNARRFSWAPVLALCRSTLQSTSSERPSSDSESRQCSLQVARLLDSGLEAGEVEIPPELRGEVSGLLALLVEDPDPTPESEQEETGLSPDVLSINSVRGVAINATLRYALWLRRRFEAVEKAEIPRGFDAMPEVRVILDGHLDIGKDPSLAVRSVYGQWFPWLAMVDERWTADNVDRIFPVDPSLARLRQAAWETYIVYCRPFTGVYSLLSDVYHWAAKQLSARQTGRGLLPRDPSIALGEHLMVLYGRGTIGIHDPTLRQFWKNADQATRRGALSFIARSLEDEVDAIPSEIITRFQELCDGRIVAAEGTKDYVNDLAEFGWWFQQKSFPEEWTLDHLERVIELTAGHIEGSTPLLERLEDIMMRDPARTLKCVEVLIKGGQKGWSIGSWTEPLRSILTKGRESDDPLVRELVVSVANQLGAIGFHEFRDLSQ